MTDLSVMTLEPLVFIVKEGSITTTSETEGNLSCSSFCFQNGAPAPMIVTPTSSDGVVTPQSSNRRQDRNKSLGHAFKQSEEDPCGDAVEALENLVEGILAVKRVLETSLDEALADPGTRHSRLSDDSKRIAELSDQLVGVLGSHLIALWNSANMVHAYAQLHNEENVILLQQLRYAQKLCIEANVHAEQVDNVNRRLYQEKQLLMGRVQQLRAERRALVKECKSLRRAAEETRKFDAWRWLEEHVMDSLAIHEMILKTSTNISTNGISRCEEETEAEDIMSKEALHGLESEVAVVPDAAVTTNKDFPTRVEKQEDLNCDDTDESSANVQKVTEEAKGSAPRKRGFFSRFSMTVHDTTNACISTNNSKRNGYSDCVEEEKRKEELHEISEELRLHINDEDPSDKQQSSLPPEKCTKDVLAAVNPDDLSLRQEESPAVIECSQYNEGHGLRGGFGRFWHANHFPQVQDASQAWNTEDESSKETFIPATSVNHVTIHANNNDKDKETVPTDNIIQNTEESSFVFDRSYRVITPTLNSKKPIQDLSSRPFALIDGHGERLANNDPIIIPWHQICHKDSTKENWNGKDRKTNPRATKADLDCPPTAKQPSRTKMCVSNNGVTSSSRSLLLVSLLLALITPSLTLQAFNLESNNRKQSYNHEHERKLPFSGASYHRSSATRLFLDDIINSTPANPKKKNLKTFQRYLEIECWKRAEIRELEPVLKSVAESCKQINRIVQRAQTDDLYGVALGVDGKPLEETNVQGEVQQQLDVLCNTYMLRAFCGSGSSIHSVASEEEEEPRCCSDVMTDSAFAVGDYIAVFDPIDGSKNIDASLPVGNIFGVYKCQPGSTVDESTFLQDGRSLVAAGYCLFSASTVLVLTLGSGVDGFTLDPDSGRFLHTLKDIRIPRKGPIYSFNEANYRGFSLPVKRFLNMLKEGGSSTGEKMTARYIGALVADVHNILINGGIYGYPSTRSNPDGKLRLLYECAPMAMILEQAGGAASTGMGRVLDVKPSEIHQRTPVFLGSVENVFELDQFFHYYDNDDGQGNRNEGA